jgi:UV DNA damage endonuclease
MTLGKEATTNRTMIKSTFERRGISYVSELALKNAEDIIKILKWNYQNGIHFFRLSSTIIPWADRFDIEQLTAYKGIVRALKEAGDYAKQYDIRITSHPGPFVVLTSPNESVVNNAITDLEMHGKIFDLMGLSHTPYNKINIHCNGVYGDKKSAMDRFCENFNRLSHSVKSRLTVENDDKASMYSVNDLMYIHNKIDIPIVFDYHHFTFNTGGQTEEDALKLAVSTWPDGIVPVVHYSESKALHENNPKEKLQAHSVYINKLPETYGLDVAIMVESKGKELSILPFIKNKILV